MTTERQIGESGARTGDPPRRVRVLSVDGGGYPGLATASFLSAAEKHFGVRTSDRFDLFCGTSTGAIIALALALGKTGDEVMALYSELGTRVFRNTGRIGYAFRVVRGFLTSRYGSGGLAGALDEAFGDSSLGDLQSQGKLALITAFNVSTGRVRVFKTDHSPRLTTDSSYLLRDVALASAAAPTYFPLAEVKSGDSATTQLFCDGGVCANHPALLGYVEAVSELNCPPDRVSVLSLSTPRFSSAEPESSRSRLWPARAFWVHRGVLLWGSRLVRIFIDGPSEVTHEALTRLAEASCSRYERVALAAPAGCEMDLATAGTTNALTVLGETEANRKEVRDRLRPFYVG